jgi:hypothetical protein
VVTYVVRYHQIFDFPILRELHKHFFVEILKMLNSRDPVLLRHIASVS